MENVSSDGCASQLERRAIAAAGLPSFVSRNSREKQMTEKRSERTTDAIIKSKNAGHQSTYHLFLTKMRMWGIMNMKRKYRVSLAWVFRAGVADVSASPVSSPRVREISCQNNRPTKQSASCLSARQQCWRGSDASPEDPFAFPSQLVYRPAYATPRLAGGSLKSRCFTENRFLTEDLLV